MLEKFFRKPKKTPPPPAPDVQFGRYSDNNKPVMKVNRWTDADTLYKEKKYDESLDAFFEYLRDDNAGNVVYERNGAEGRFEIFQGSKIVRGRFDREVLKAEVTLAKMPQPSVPVMRRLLEMNFNLYYSRFALDQDRLCMLFDSDIETSSPSKMYYGLKELATRADKHDDLLVQDFSSLETIDSDHVRALPEPEKEIKFSYLQSWIKKTLDTISTLDPDKFSGGIAYLLLSLIYRIDYLVAPEGRLLNDLEKIGSIYFKKDERPVVEKNRDMAEEFRKILTRPKEDIYSCLFRSRYTFSIVSPQNYKTIADSIHNSNLNVAWYRDNNYPFIAAQIAEYGIAYCQYSYSLPRVITEYYHLLMMVNYPDYFADLGFLPRLYDPVKTSFEKNEIIDRINQIGARWKEKYPLMQIRTSNVQFDSLVGFNLSFTTELETLNMEPR